MPKLIDLTGERYGRLTVVERAENIGRTTVWKCLCDCGNTTTVRQPDLRNGRTKSCGCLFSEELSKRNTKHGLSRTRLSSIWRGIKDRCFNPNNHAYENYGGRNVTVCEEWANDFKKFYDWSISHGYTDELTIDRIDVNGNYEPSNCRWVDKKAQANNTRRNHFLEYNGKKQTISQWAGELGMDEHKIIVRLRRGWTIERTLMTP